MRASTLTKDQIHEKIGKKRWIDNQQILASKLDYIGGITVFDEILDGKSINEINAVIHFEKYPKGFLFKIVRGFGGIKSYPFPIAESEIHQIVLKELNDNDGKLTLVLKTEKKIEFNVKKGYYREVYGFLKDTKAISQSESTRKPTTSISIENKPENQQKHGIPALFSFFIPGIGQLIKGHIIKSVAIWGSAVLIWLLFFGTLLSGHFAMSFVFYLLPIAIWLWNVYDAYNSNENWKIN